jgi:hypothetical protein
MNNQNVVVHKIGAGENLYELAKQYNTTVDGIIASNPYLDPYKLRIGDQILIYPGRYGLKGYTLSMNEQRLTNNMRLLWEQHVFWTRLLILSIADNLKDIDFTTRRLLRNPNDTSDLFKTYYGSEVAKRIADLLTDHLTIADKLIRALKANDQAATMAYNTSWHKNADDIAFALGSINPYFVEPEVRDMLYKHLDVTSKEVTDRLAGNYAADVTDFDNVEQQALMMADYFTKGIVNQFPDRFTQ